MRHFLTAVIGLAAMSLLLGCQKKEKVIDIETPAGGIEITRSGDKVEIESKNGDGQSVKIDIQND